MFLRLQLLPFLLLRFKRNFVYTTKESDWVLTPNELSSPRLLEQRIVALIITVTFATLLLRLEDVRLIVLRGSTFLITGSRSRKVLEYMFWIKEFGVNVLGCQEVSANDEDFG